MKKISCTRMELLAHKAQITLAEQGRELLEQKRTALMKEFMHIADRVVEHSEKLQETATEARMALARAEVIASPQAVQSAALASQAEFSLQVTTANVMGVRVPHIQQVQALRPALGRDFSIVGTSIAIDEAATSFEAFVDAIIQLAESELRLTRLAEEIRITSRRLNALDHLLIPSLKSELEFIQMALDERERTDHFRYKLIKQILENRRGG